MSASDSDASNDSEFSTPVKSALKTCFNMKPDIVNQPSFSGYSSKKSRRKKLDEAMKTVCDPTTEKPRKSGRTENKKKVDDSYKEIMDDFGKLYKKIDIFYGALQEVHTYLDELEDRIIAIEKENKKTYAKITASPPLGPTNVDRTKQTDNRIEKLEFLTSEEERKRRLLQVTLTHSEINSNSDMEAVKVFLTSKLRMAPHEIDTNMSIQKLPREKTVLLCMTDKKFKIFLYKAKKKLRLENDENSNELYLNDNLTPLNHSILMSAKRKKRDESVSNIKSVYSFEGKVFVKFIVGGETSEALHVKNLSMVDGLRPKPVASVVDVICC